MSMRPLILGGLALLLFIGLSPGVAMAAPQEAEQSEPACGDCHDIAKPFTGNPHAHGKVTDGNVPNSVCESCHGDGTAHIEAGGDTTLIVKPQGYPGAEICVKCHSVTNDRKTRKSGMHSNSVAVNCLSCHSIHHNGAGTRFLLVQKELALCSTCHGTQAASFRNKPFAHRLGRGGMECSSCHEPHGRPARESLRNTAAGEAPCFECHADKRGPWVFPHGAIVNSNDCSNCHQPHGSVNPKQLARANVFQLCLECHSPISGGTLGSQPPSFHNLSSPRYQNCTTCHVAIHGSNRDPQLMK